MKKLKFNSTLNHKQSSYDTREIIVEKEITLYGSSFSELKDHPLSDNQYIAQNRDLMYIDNNDTAHCLLMVDYDSGDGILVESEGSNYARKSQFIPNSRELIENNDLTASERKLHNSLRKIVDQIAELAHCGEKSFVFEELLDKSDIDLKSLLRDSVTAMLKDREDIKFVKSQSIDADFQPDITVEAKPTQELTFYCPLKIARAVEGYSINDCTIIPSDQSIAYESRINEFLADFELPEEENRGLMAYFDRNPAVKEKVFSAIPSVKKIDDELVGVIECQVIDGLSVNELEDLRSYLIGQLGDGWGESVEQRSIKTADYGEIYVSFWNDSNEWSLQTAEEMGIEQTKDLYEEPEIEISM